MIRALLNADPSPPAIKCLLEPKLCCSRTPFPTVMYESPVSPPPGVITDTADELLELRELLRELLDLLLELLDELVELDEILKLDELLDLLLELDDLELDDLELELELKEALLLEAQLTQSAVTTRLSQNILLSGLNGPVEFPTRTKTPGWVKIFCPPEAVLTIKVSNSNIPV